MATGAEVGRISIRVMPDTDKFRSELKKQLELIERELRGTVEVDVELDTAAARAELERLKRSGGSIDVDVDVDRNSIRRSRGAIDKLFSMPSFGSGINPSAMLVILAGIAAVAAPLLGLITTALLTLPGLIALVATPIGALVLGFDGLKEAANSIKQPFENLKTVMSDAVQAQFTPAFEKLAEIFPTLERSLPNVSAGVANLMQGISNTLTRPENMLMIEETINNIGSALTNAQPGVNGFVDGFIRLANVFSEKLPGIIDWFNGAGTSFNNWITEMDKSGELSTSFDTLGTTLKSILETLGKLAIEGMKFVSDPSKVDGFKESLDGILGSLESIAEMSNAIADVWDVVSFVGSSIKEIVSNPTTGFDTVFGPAIFGGEGGARDWREAAKNAAAGVDEVKTAVDQIPPAADAANTSLEQLMTMPPAQGGIVEQLQQGLNAPAEGGPALEPPPVAPPDTEAAKAQVAEYQQFVDTVTEQVRGSLEQATTGESMPPPNFDAFKAAWDSLPGMVTGAVEAMKAAAAGALTGVETSFVDSGGRIVAEVSSWPGKISAALSGMYGAGQEAGAQIANGMVAGIQGGIPSVTAAAQSLAAAASAAARAELGIKSPSRVFMAIGGYTAEGFYNGMNEGFKPVMGLAQDLSKQVTEAFLTNQGMSESMAAALAAGGVADQLKMQEEELKAQQDALDIEKLRAEIAEKKAISDEEKERTKAVSETLSLRQSELDLQKKQLELTKKETKATSDLNKEYGSLLGKALGVPVDMADAAATQFITDLGFSNTGLAPTLMNEGVKYIFNVNGVDEALAIKQREQNKQALQFTNTGR